jgi:clathrin heavy chain
MNYSPDQENDFPIYMQICSKYGLLMVVTKLGYLHLFEISSCQQIAKQKISQDTVFVGTRLQKNDGALLVNKSGSLLAVSIDPQNLVSYIMNQCTFIPDNRNVGIQLASRYGLPGADGLFLEQFNRALSGMDIVRAS